MSNQNNPSQTPRNGSKPTVFSKNGIDLNASLVDEMAADASPRQLKNLITHLEEIYDKRRTDNRSDLKKQVDKLLLSNDYSVEELYAARPIPTMDELAAQAKDRKRNKQSKREEMINSMLGT